jgi:hypothetical protein
MPYGIDARLIRRTRKKRKKEKKRNNLLNPQNSLTQSSPE